MICLLPSKIHISCDSSALLLYNLETLIVITPNVLGNEESEILVSQSNGENVPQSDACISKTRLSEKVQNTSHISFSLLDKILSSASFDLGHLS